MSLSEKSKVAMLKYTVNEINKKELIGILNKESKKKTDAIKRKDGSIDYLKMSQMYHSGEW